MSVSASSPAGLRALALIALIAVAAAPSRGAPAPTPTRRASPTLQKSPDVRRGETYDGRPAAPDRTAPLRAVPRALLFLPRAVVTVVLRTAVATVDWLETSGVVPAIQRVFWGWDGRLRILPEGSWRDDVTSQWGARVATDLLFGGAHRAGLIAQGSYGEPQVWTTRLRLHPLGVHLPGRPAPPGRWHLVLDGGYATRDDVPFHSVGYFRDRDDVAPPAAQYRREIAHALAGLSLRLWRRLRLHARLGYEWRRLSDGEAGEARPPLSRVYGTHWPGWVTGLRAFHGELRLSWGGPLGGLLPARGLRAEVSAALWTGDLRTNRLLRLSGHVEAFHGFAGGQQRLGLRGRVTGVGGLHGQAVPMVYLPHLGGRDTMRGFAEGRFQGETVAWLTFEYYAALHPRLWLALFVDWGGAWRERFGDHGWDRLDVSGGGWLGLRVAPGFWLHLQVAGSREGPVAFVGWRSGP